MTHVKNSQIAAVAGLLLLTAFGLGWSGMADLKNYALIASSFVAGWSIAAKGFKALRMKAFSIELLVTIAVVGALIIGEYVEAAVVTFLFVFGAYLEARTLERTRASLKNLIDETPTEATVIRPEGNIRIPADDLKRGDRVLIRSGEKIAVDGQILVGQALITEAAITGESVPASKAAGDRVYSGTIVSNGYLEVMAERVGDDTTFSKIVELVENAQEAKTKTQKFLDRFANIYTPSIVVLAVLVYALTKNVELALTFLVIACPGALVISAPVSMVAGIGNGARNGVLIKGGDIMEKLAKINAVVFDKTGTLTKGRPEVTDVKTWSGNENDMLHLAAQAEVVSEHHLGQTIVAEAKKRGLALNTKPEHAEIIEGNGMIGVVQGRHLVIGNRKLMASRGISIDPVAENDAIVREKAGNTAVFVAIDGVLTGLIAIADQIKPEASQAIAKLRAQGVQKIYMLSGDNRHTAQLVGDELALDAVHAELLPQDKVDYINTLKAQGFRVAMVGDGVNDAPALAAADVGLAMGMGGTDITMETADVVLMSDRLDHFAHAHGLAKATVSNMMQNTLFAVSTVMILLAGVVLGKVFLSSGMLVHEISVLLVILNAIRLVRYKDARNAVAIPAGADARMAGQKG